MTIIDFGDIRCKQLHIYRKNSQHLARPSGQLYNVKTTPNDCFLLLLKIEIKFKNIYVDGYSEEVQLEINDSIGILCSVSIPRARLFFLILQWNEPNVFIKSIYTVVIEIAFCIDSLYFPIKKNLQLTSSMWFSKLFNGNANRWFRYVENLHEHVIEQAEISISKNIFNPITCTYIHWDVSFSNSITNINALLSYISIQTMSRHQSRHRPKYRRVHNRC